MELLALIYCPFFNAQNIHISGRQEKVSGKQNSISLMRENCMLEDQKSFEFLLKKQTNNTYLQPWYSIIQNALSLWPSKWINTIFPLKNMSFVICRNSISTAFGCWFPLPKWGPPGLKKYSLNWKPSGLLWEAEIHFSDELKQYTWRSWMFEFFKKIKINNTCLKPWSSIIQMPSHFDQVNPI